MIQSFLHFLGNAPKDSMFPIWWFSYSVIGWLSYCLAILFYCPKGERLGAILLGILAFGILGPLGSVLGPMCLILHHPAVFGEMKNYSGTVASRIKSGMDID